MMPNSTSLLRSIQISALAILAACLMPVMSAQAQNAQLEADAVKLYACIAAAYPEGEIPLRAGEPPRKRTAPGDCMDGLIAKSCGASHCNGREARAWLHLARRRPGEDGSRVSSGPNGKAYQAALTGLQKQAFAICTAAAAASAWGSDDVLKGKFRISLDHPCVRETLAGMIVPMLGYAQGS